MTKKTVRILLHKWNNYRFNVEIQKMAVSKVHFFGQAEDTTMLQPTTDKKFYGGPGNYGTIFLPFSATSEPKIDDGEGIIFGSFTWTAGVRGQRYEQTDCCVRSAVRRLGNEEPLCSSDNADTTFNCSPLKSRMSSRSIWPCLALFLARSTLMILFGSHLWIFHGCLSAVFSFNLFPFRGVQERAEWTRNDSSGPSPSHTSWWIRGQVKQKVSSCWSWCLLWGCNTESKICHQMCCFCLGA